MVRIAPVALIAAMSVSAAIQPLAQTSGFRGRVVDATGQAMPGVSVGVRPAAGGPVARTATGKTGAYSLELPPGQFDVFAFLDGFETIRLIDASAVKERWLELDFRMQLGMRLECISVEEPPFGTIQGVVADSKGFPLPFAVVHVQQVSGTRIYGEKFLTASGYADENGRYAANAPAGRHRVSAEYPGYVALPWETMVTVGKTTELALPAEPVGGRKRALETLHTITNCGRLGFRSPALPPRVP